MYKKALKFHVFQCEPKSETAEIRQIVALISI